MYLSKTILIFISNGQGVVGEFNSYSNAENSFSKILLQPKKSAFSKSLIVMKCFKDLICILLSTEY